MRDAVVTLIFYSAIILMMVMILVRMIIGRRRTNTQHDLEKIHEAWYHIDLHDVKDRMSEFMGALFHGAIVRGAVKGLVVAERTVRRFDIRLRKSIMGLVNQIDKSPNKNYHTDRSEASPMKYLYEQASHEQSWDDTASEETPEDQ